MARRNSGYYVIGGGATSWHRTGYGAAREHLSRCQQGWHDVRIERAKDGASMTYEVGTRGEISEPLDEFHI